MEKVFAIGDIHGNYNLLEKILSKWNPKEEQLVFLGDYIDRGPDSLKVIRKVIELSKEYEVITLSGNHEQIFLYWLQNAEKSSDFYFHEKVGGVQTLQSFLPSIENGDTILNMNVNEVVQLVKEQNGNEIDFMKHLRTYYQWGSFLFVHAGIDAHVEDYKETKEENFYWIREEFYSVPHVAKESIVFGHTPTLNLNHDKSNNVWISSCRKKIGIDGGVIYPGGQLHGVILTKDSDELVIYAAKKDEEVFSYRMTF
nr:metallophosphoesterase family protein [Lysinibacillus timonensis]